MITKSQISEVAYSPYWDEWNIRFLLAAQTKLRDEELCGGEGPYPSTFGEVEVYEFENDLSQDENIINAEFKVLFENKPLTDSFLEGFELITQFMKTYKSPKRD
jgi:hypothetical protein